MSTSIQVPIQQSKVNPVAKITTGLSGNELLVDFNLILHEALRRVEGCTDKGKAIIRCDRLPYIFGEEEVLKQLSNNLIDLIIQYPPQKSKLFIYIKCDQITIDNMQLEIEGLHGFDICFHTNSCSESMWQVFNQERILRCALICEKYNGSFAYAVGNADYLFKLTLFGKLK